VDDRLDRRTAASASVFNYDFYNVRAVARTDSEKSCGLGIAMHSTDD